MKNLRPVKLLLIEDARPHAVFFRAALNRALKIEFHIDVVDNLTDGFDILKESSYDLIALDLGLPESRGIDTLHTFIEEVGDQHPLIVLTSMEDPEVGEEALRLGALDFLTKDEFGPDQLARTVRYALERSRQRKELATAETYLKSFAHSAAHDIKSPITSIISYAKVVNEILSDEVEDTEAGAYLELIVDFAEQAEHLVDGLLKFSVLGQKSVKLETVDLSRVAQQAVKNLTAVIKQSDARVTISRLPKGKADPDLLVHVFQNLIANGVKYQNGSTPEILVSGTQEGSEVTISVRDNGCGIDEEHTARIFEPFKRITDDKESEGCGLGLAISKSLVNAHEGKIWVESTKGDGSNFRFTLPAAS